MSAFLERAKQAKALFENKKPESVAVCQHERCTHDDCLVNGRFWCFKSDAINDDVPMYREMSDVIYEAGVDDGFAYEVVATFLEQIVSSEIDEPEAADELIEEEEPPVYTSDLTAWLNLSNHHVGYLTDALKEYGDLDGFQALGMAWSMAYREVAAAVIDKLQS